MNDVLGLLHHLVFRDPQGGPGHGDGEVVDLNAVELTDGDFYGVEARHAQGDLALLLALHPGDPGRDDLILDLPQAEVAFREEVPAAGGGVYQDVIFDTNRICARCPETA